MNLPKGTTFMPEGLKLTQADLTDMLSNLGTHGFSGYLQIELPKSSKGYVFLSRGQTVRAFEWSQQGKAKLYTPERLFAKVGDQGAACASYVLSGEMANQLADSFGFQPGQDWKAQFQQEKHTGFAVFGNQAVLFAKGQPLQETLAHGYGQVVCSRDAVHALLQQDQASQVFSQQPAVLEQTARRLHADLSRMREVRLKSVSGFFATKDALKVDAEVAQEWGVKGTFTLVVEDLEGRHIGTLKTHVGSKKPQVMEIPLKIMQEWGLAEDQAVMVYPHVES